MILHPAEPAIVRLSPCWVRLFSGIAIALQELSIQRYCYRYASSLLASVGLHSAEPAIVGLSLCRSCLFRSIAIDILALYWLAFALCRACYRPFIVLQELSIQLYCYRPAGSLSPCWVILHSAEPAIVRLSSCWELSIQMYCYRPASFLLASVGLHSAEPAIVGLSSCRVRLFSCIAIALLALYIPASDIALCRACYRWSIVCRSYLFSGIAIDMLALYIPAGDITLCRACYRWSIVCRSYLFSGIAIDMLALYWLSLVCRPAGCVYSAVLLSICWLSISLLVILHSVKPASVRLSPCRSCLFRSIAIDMLALYFPAGDIALCRAC